MNEIQTLESAGLTLPAPTYLLGAIVFGIAGYLAYRRGKKAQNTTVKWTGIALMLYPYAVSNTWLMWAVGLALCRLAYAYWE